jgi:hypothetical protein
MDARELVCGRKPDLSGYSNHKLLRPDMAANLAGQFDLGAWDIRAHGPAVL